MENLERFKIGVSKKILFICGGVLWAFAGGRVVTLGVLPVFQDTNNILTYLFLALGVFYIFYNKIFMKLVHKHVSRIKSSELESHCIFSFFDFKSYCIMAFMISFSAVLRKLNIINPGYLGSFYIGLGTALFISGVMFFSFGFKRQVIEFSNKIS